MTVHKVSEYQEISHIEGNYEQVFLGEVYGIGLARRGPNDHHVCFYILAGDDGLWRRKSGSSSSSSWFSDLVQVIGRAEQWCKEFCDPDINDDRQYGWKFREAAK